MTIIINLADRKRTQRLLEASPYSIDRGQLIGRDPRHITPTEAAEAGVTPDLAKAAIRAKCLDCVGGDLSEVRKCVSTACPLWFFRMTGSLPAAHKAAALGKSCASASAVPHEDARS